MTDSTRAHQRVPERETAGVRHALSIGTLLMPPGSRRSTMPLVVHFHGAPWLAEWSVRKRLPRAAVISVQLGAGSGVYSKAFSDPQTFLNLLDEVSGAAGVKFRPVVLTSFSAGYGAIREILRSRDNWSRIDGVLLMDSLHSGYTTGSTPGPVEAEPLKPFVEFAREAVAGRKRMLVTHSEIFPGTFASTTETTDLLLAELHLRRTAVLRWGPLGMQQLSSVRAGRFELRGFAGNTAPDHVDHFHALSEWLKQFRIN